MKKNADRSYENTNPKQSQYKPKTNPNKPNFKRGSRLDFPKIYVVISS
jgi:hypothetical protein